MKIREFLKKARKEHPNIEFSSRNGMILTRNRETGIKWLFGGYYDEDHVYSDAVAYWLPDENV